MADYRWYLPINTMIPSEKTALHKAYLKTDPSSGDRYITCTS